MNDTIDVAKTLLKLAEETEADYVAAKLTPDGSVFPKDWRIRIQVFRAGSEHDGGDE